MVLCNRPVSHGLSWWPTPHSRSHHQEAALNQQARNLSTTSLDSPVRRRWTPRRTPSRRRPRLVANGCKGWTIARLARTGFGVAARRIAPGGVFIFAAIAKVRSPANHAYAARSKRPIADHRIPGFLLASACFRDRMNGDRRRVRRLISLPLPVCRGRAQNGPVSSTL